MQEGASKDGLSAQKKTRSDAGFFSSGFSSIFLSDFSSDACNSTRRVNATTRAGWW
ncbi:hypothetical protein PSP6_470070 [Paraburkholderia tropica]|nr:hypothetical protein PSP6_470070 [Paraburkholderia tropica]